MSDKGSILSRKRRLALSGAGLVSAVALSVAGAYVFTSAPLGDWDEAAIEVAYFDARTHEPLAASSERLARALAAAHPGANSTLFGSDQPFFRELRLPVGSATENGTLANLLSVHLRGTRAGDVITTPEFEQGLGAWEHEVDIPRTYGPFPLTHDFPREDFESRYGPPIPGQVITDGRLSDAELEIVEVTDTTVRYRTRLATDDVIHLRKPAWPATVIIDESTGTFVLRLDPPVGTASSYSCSDTLLNLTPGSYKVLAANETYLRLAYSPILYPQFVERPVYAKITVIGEHKLARLGHALSSLVNPKDV